MKTKSILGGGGVAAEQKKRQGSGGGVKAAILGEKWIDRLRRWIGPHKKLKNLEKALVKKNPMAEVS